MERLTPKQKMFCDEYLVDLNATKAAIRAGYSPKSARQAGTENLSKPSIRAYIEKRVSEKEDELIAKQDELMRYLTAVMRREYKESVVVTLTTETSTYAPDAEGKMRKQTVREQHTEIVEIPARLSDANKAAETLARIYGLFKDNMLIESEERVLIVDNMEDADDDMPYTE